MTEFVKITKYFLDNNRITLRMKAHAIKYAIEMNKPKSFELFIDSIDDINEISAYTETTPLNYAIICMNDNYVRKLLKKGAEIDARDSKGRTALHNAVESGSILIVSILLERYLADARAVDNEGNTPLHLAVIRNNMFMAEYLLKSGANPHLVNVSSISSLDLALEKGYDYFINLFDRCELVNKVKESKNEPISKASDAEIDNENSIPVESSQHVVKVEGYEFIDLNEDHFPDNFLNVMKPSADFSPEEDQAIRAIYYKKDCESAESDDELVGFGHFEKSDELVVFEGSEESDDFEII